MPNRLFRVGAGGTDTVADLKGIVATPSNANYMTLETPIGTDYQVPAGKTFYITSIRYHAGSANSEFNLGYGDTGVPDQAGAPTAAVTLSSLFAAVAAETQYEVDVFFSVPALKYPFVKSNLNAIRIQVFGLEL